METQTGSSLGARRGYVVKATPPPLSRRERDPAPLAQEVGWTSGPVWTDGENLAPTGF
jgi:hypothetical protein